MSLNKFLGMSIVLFIIGGVSLSVTYEAITLCYPPPGHPYLPTECPNSTHYSLAVITTIFFALAIVLLFISHKNNQSTEKISQND